MLDTALDAAAYAVLDVETTGLRPGVDRIVEIAIVRLDPGEEPAILLDTLVDPRGPVDGTRIHRIRAEDVDGAPTFAEIAGDVMAALGGRVLVGHNVTFDHHFLEAELGPRGEALRVPMVDTSLLRPLLADGPRASLDDTCRAYGLARQGAHAAALDAWDAGRLLAVLLARARQRGLRTFRELSRLGNQEWLRSLRHRPLDARRPAVACRRKPRAATAASFDPLRAYYEHLLMVLADGHVTPGEQEALRAQRVALGLADEDVLGLHAQAFTGALLAGVGDRRIEQQERDYLRNLAACLRSLGWCPGD